MIKGFKSRVNPFRTMCGSKVRRNYIFKFPGSKNNPNGKKAIEVINIAYHRYNISLGAGLTQVAGKVFRIGHLGDNNEARMMAALGAVEMAMIDAGIKFTPGSGTGAAAKYWTSNPDKTKIFDI